LSSLFPHIFHSFSIFVLEYQFIVCYTVCIINILKGLTIIIMRILGIDYGDARVGVAVSDLLGLTAQGVGTVKNTGKKSLWQSF
jgi:hypothetical protein